MFYILLAIHLISRHPIKALFETWWHLNQITYHISHASQGRLRDVFCLDCASGWSGLLHTGKCYKHVPTKTTWPDAWASCQKLAPSGNLASIPDKTTNDFLTKLANDKFWTGGFQASSGKFVWMNGDQWTGYTSWAPGEPTGGSNQYIEVHTESTGEWRPGMWNDAISSDKLGAMCQYDPGQGQGQGK